MSGSAALREIREAQLESKIASEKKLPGMRRKWNEFGFHRVTEHAEEIAGMRFQILTVSPALLAKRRVRSMLMEAGVSIFAREKSPTAGLRLFRPGFESNHDAGE